MKKDNSWFPVSFLMSWGHFIDDMYPGILPPLIPLLMVDYDFSITFAGLLASLAAFSNSFMQPLFGYFSDRIGRRTFIIFGPLIAAIFYTCIGYMPNKWFLVACVFIGGSGVAMFHPQAAKITFQAGGDNQGKAMSVFTTGGTIGYPLGALLISSVIVPYFGLKAAPVLIIPVLILIGFMLKYAPKQQKSDSPPGLRKMIPSVRMAFSLGIYVLINVFRALAVMGFNLLIPIWYSQMNLSLQYGGYAIFIFHFFGGLGGLLGGFLSDKYSPRRIIVLSFLLSTVFFLLFQRLEGIAGLAVLGLAGMMVLLSIPAVINLAQTTMPEHRGTAASLVMGFSWGVGGVLVMGMSRLADVYGVRVVMEYLSYVPLLAVALGLMLTKKVRRSDIPPEIPIES